MNCCEKCGTLDLTGKKSHLHLINFFDFFYIFWAGCLFKILKLEPHVRGYIYLKITQIVSLTVLLCENAPGTPAPVIFLQLHTNEL